MFPGRKLLALLLLLFGFMTLPVYAKEDLREPLWDAVRNGDAKKVQELLDKGADVNAKSEIGISALWIAANKGKLDIIELLVKKGADVNTRDEIWYQTPLIIAVSSGKVDVLKFLIDKGAKDVDAAMMSAAGTGRGPVIEALLEKKKFAQEVLDAAMFSASKFEKTKEILKKAGAKEIKPFSESERADWKSLTGSFEQDNGSQMKIELGEVGLQVSRQGSATLLKPVGKDVFQPYGSSPATYTFERKNGKVYRVILKMFTAEYSFYNIENKPVPKVSQQPKEDKEGAVKQPKNWPSFRGPDATGVADDQYPPTSWDVKKNVNVAWKTPIPGLGHSCPVVWGDKVFVSTAISTGEPNPKVRIGNYGAVESVNDVSKHTWQLYCLDRDTGKILWSKTPFEGIPKIKRHLKGSQANCTPVTDGKRVVVCFGSEGMYCYDFSGKELWKRDLGSIDSSFKMDKEYEWGFGSSPCIYEDLVILQADLSKDSFIAAYRLEDGSKVWSTPRDEIPSWSSPTIWKNSKRTEIVTNAAQYARSYDPLTGKELWRLAKKSEVTIPAPVIQGDQLIITSGNRPIQPIISIKPGGEGDISLQSGEETNNYISWSKMRGGPYMPTPILYGKYLYTCGNGGMVTCYEATSGKEVYKERLGGTSYTASPVAADGKIYFTSEEGQVRVLKAGPQFELLAVNEMDDICMATPAISAGKFFVRTQHSLIALEKKRETKN